LCKIFDINIDHFRAVRSQFASGMPPKVEDSLIDINR